MSNSEEEKDKLPKVNPKEPQPKEPESESEDPEILDNLPPEAKKMMEIFAMQSFSGRVPNPILNKITSEHIDKILDQGAREEQHDFEDAKVSKRYNLVYFVLILSLVVFLVIYLSDKNKDLLKDLAEKAIFLLAGFGSGYGFKAYKDNQ